MLFIVAASTEEQERFGEKKSNDMMDFNWIDWIRNGYDWEAVDCFFLFYYLTDF